MKSKVFDYIINNRLLITMIVLFLTIFLGRNALRIEFDNTIETYFLDKDVKDYHEFLDQFGSDQIIVAAFENGDAFSTENISLVDRISRRIEKLPHVRRVLSLSTADIVSAEDDMVFLDRLFDTVPPAGTEINKAREKALIDPYLPGTIISKDGRKTAIIAEIEHISNNFDYKIELIDNIKKIISSQVLTG